MKINFANRDNDKNILEKKCIMTDVKFDKFDGKITLIHLLKVKEVFRAVRNNGDEEIIIADGYNIMTYFPKNEKYSINIMYDNNYDLLQWYFDINKNICKYDNENIPHSEDLFLDVVVLPNGEFYNIDHEDLENALEQKKISEFEYQEAYKTMESINQMIENEFDNLKKFTNFSLEKLRRLENIYGV